MAEVTNQMYCSEQISIPPSFPYLLRQFAKSAIRSQPVDLLRWSTAYFRCLSLNIPPPIKPRLEYPIPKDYYGMTPGWLKALLYQLQGNQTIAFKTLWDRWTGACLEHRTLIQILCLGGFTDPSAIPWLRFIGLCTAHLTENLTDTMKMICEILTEEPEGGSASIQVKTFLDLYTFLAAIDASKPQILKNMYFTDSLLSLWEKKQEEEKVEEKVVEEIASDITSTNVEKSEEVIQVIEDKVESKETISCPSVTGDDDYELPMLDYHYREGEEEEEEEEEQELDDHLTEGIEFSEAPDEQEPDVDYETASREEYLRQIKFGDEEGDDTEFEGFRTQPDEAKTSEGTIDIEGEEEKSIDANESVDTIIEDVPKLEERFFEDEKGLQEDLAKLKAYQIEMAGETDEEIEKFKCKLIEDMPLSDSQIKAIETFKEKETERQPSIEEKVDEESVEEPQYEDVYVDSVPGIGGIVPENLVNSVCEYMKGVAKIQHGMVMPRNIRHYTCPPLEQLEY